MELTALALNFNPYFCWLKFLQTAEDQIGISAIAPFF
jgi:hypothetical protein